MKFDNIRVYNFQNALRGMRNPKESYHLSDSEYGLTHMDYVGDIIQDCADKYGLDITDEIYDKLAKNIILYCDDDYCEFAAIGPKDMKLAQTLIKAGPEHRKFMRQIFVSVDITAPLYWWKEFDTYKVGTVANSTSTMHKIASKPITSECFELDDYAYYGTFLSESLGANSLSADDCEGLIFSDWILFLEGLRLKYLETNDKRYWKELIRWLPESWLQTRTVTMNYENLLAICSKGQRRFHKLTEWSNMEENSDSFIKMSRDLPYAQEFIFIDEIQ